MYPENAGGTKLYGRKAFLTKECGKNLRNFGVLIYILFENTDL